MTYFVHGPDDDLFLRSKHVAFYMIKPVVLDVKVFLVILNISYHIIECVLFYKTVHAAECLTLQTFQKMY